MLIELWGYFEEAKELGIVKGIVSVQYRVGDKHKVIYENEEVYASYGKFFEDIIKTFFGKRIIWHRAKYFKGENGFIIYGTDTKYSRR